jgi:hypothetical protein
MLSIGQEYNDDLRQLLDLAAAGMCGSFAYDIPVARVIGCSRRVTMSFRNIASFLNEQKSGRENRLAFGIRTPAWPSRRLVAGRRVAEGPSP